MWQGRETIGGLKANVGVTLAEIGHNNPKSLLVRFLKNYLINLMQT